jgi:hypothetical protein
MIVILALLLVQTPPTRQWFESLQNRIGIPCCSVADGRAVADPDWRRTMDGYQVFYAAQWWPVPPEAVVSERNRIGHAVLWAVDVGDGIAIRCFMPGAEG